MLEVDLASSSHLIDPQLHIWGWEIPVYLFLGGVAAGLMVMSAVLGLRDPDGQRSRRVRLVPLAVPVILSPGTGALFLDLELTGSATNSCTPLMAAFGGLGPGQPREVPGVHPRGWPRPIRRELGA